MYDILVKYVFSLNSFKYILSYVVILIDFRYLQPKLVKLPIQFMLSVPKYHLISVNPNNAVSALWMETSQRSVVIRLHCPVYSSSLFLCSKLGPLKTLLLPSLQSDEVAFLTNALCDSFHQGSGIQQGNLIKSL